MLAWLLLLLAGLLQLRNTEITHDLTQFMPAGATREQQLAIRLIREGPASRLILMALEGGDGRELATASRTMTRVLRESGLFSMVTNGSVDWSAEPGPVFRYRYLLDNRRGVEEQFDAASLRQSLQQRLQEISTALPLVDSTQLASDPTAAYRSILQSWRPPRQPDLRQGVWFTSDGQAALVMALVGKSGFDPEAQQRALDCINTTFENLASGDSLRLIASGTPVFTSNTRREIHTSLRILSVAAGLLVTGFLLLVYRSVKLFLLATLPLFSGLIAGGALTSLLFGNLHGITLIFGITLLGVAIDYPIHLYSHLVPGRTPAQSMSRIWPTIRMGMITTCIGYLALVHTDFSGLAQLGIFTGSGLAVAAAVTRWILPPLLASATGHATVRPLPVADHLLNLPVPVRRIIPAGILLGACAALLLSPPRWETDLAALSPIPAGQLQTDARLRSELGTGDASLLLVITGSDAETVLEQSEDAVQRLAGAVEDGLLAGYDYAARYLPSARTQRHRQSLLPERATLEKNLASAMQGLPYKATAFRDFVAAVAESRNLPPLTLQDIGNTLLESRVGALLFRDGQDQVALITLTGVRDVAGFRAWWEQTGPAGAELLDLKEISTAMLTGFRVSALNRLMLGLLAISVILFAGLRSPLQVLRVLLPVVLAAAATVSLLGLLDRPLSLFHLIALLLTVGIGIDYSLFFNRLATDVKDGRQTISAIVVCAVSTVTIFGVLALSSIPVLQAIGLTVAIGVSLSILLVLTVSRRARPTA